MPFINRLHASEKGVILCLVGLGLRPPLIFLYTRFLGEKVANIFFAVTASLIFIEGIFVVPPLMPSSTTFVPSRIFFKVGIAIESTVSLISFGLFFHSLFTFTSFGRLICAFLFLLTPSVVRWWIHSYFHHLFFSSREPVLQNKMILGSNSIALESFEDEEDGALASAYRELKSSASSCTDIRNEPEWPERLLNDPSTWQPTPLSTSKPNSLLLESTAENPAESLQPASLIESVSVTHSEPSNLRLSLEAVSLLQQTFSQPIARYHHNTVIFANELLDYLIAFNVALTLFELIFSIPCISFIRKVGINVIVKLFLPALFSASFFASIKIFLMHWRAIYFIAVTFLATFVMYFVAATSCKDKCSEFRTAPVAVIIVQVLQTLHLCSNIPFLGVPVLVWLSQKKCTCCGLSSCLMNRANEMEHPYFLWQETKLRQA